MAKQKMTEPVFTRSEIAEILNVSTLTIANREKNKKYPEPKRDMNNYRIYSLNDVFNLQLITYNHINPKPVISILFDKGYKDSKLLGEMIDNVLSRRSNVNAK
jgi:transcriptional regulator with XRE-family HTH domain